MRALDRDEEFVITRNGVPVGELKPIRRRRFVRSALLRDAFAGAEPISAERLRADVDALVDQGTWPDD